MFVFEIDSSSLSDLDVCYDKTLRIFRILAISLIGFLIVMQTACGGTEHFDRRAYALILTSLAGGATKSGELTCAGNTGGIPLDFYNRWKFNFDYTDSKGTHDFTSSSGNIVYSQIFCRDISASLQLDGSSFITSSVNWRPGVSWSISAWIYQNQNNTNSPVYSVYNTSGYRWNYNTSTGNLEVGFSSPTFTVALLQQDWAHVVFTTDATGFNLYPMEYIKKGRELHSIPVPGEGCNLVSTGLVISMMSLHTIER